MRVHIPSPLHAYTGGRSALEARGGTLGELLEDLDRRHPGIRFRMVDEQDGIREHIRIFLGGERVQDLGLPLDGAAEVHILAALSGG